MTDTNRKKLRGFASMDKQKQKEIAAKGGKNSALTHEQAVEIGRKGGKAAHAKRGLAAADLETRKRVARAGGKATSGKQSKSE